MEENRALLDEVIEKTLKDLKSLQQGSKEYAQAVEALSALSTMKKELGEVGVKAIEAETKRHEADTKRLEAESNKQKAKAEIVKAEAETKKAQAGYLANICNVGNWLLKGGIALFMFNKSLDFDKAGGFIDAKNAWFQAQRGIDRFFRDKESFKQIREIWQICWVSLFFFE